MVDREESGGRDGRSRGWGRVKGRSVRGGSEKNNLENRGHTIHWYLQGTTRTMSRALVWGDGGGVAGRDAGTARKGVARLLWRVLNATFFSR